MVVTDAQVDSLKEDIRVIGDTVAELVTRVAAHDRRFDQVDRRLDGIDGRLGTMDGTLHEILALVRGPQPGRRSSWDV